MKRVVGYLVGLAVLCLVLVVPALIRSGGDAAIDSDISIDSYRATLDVDENGDLTVDETLDVAFLVGGKHGIFRYWDRRDPNAPHARRDPHDVVVTMDGQDVPVELSDESGRRYLVARVGDPNSTVSTGNHTYRIHYEVDGVLEPGVDADSETQLYWELVPHGPQIGEANLTVHLPAAAEHVECAVGAGQTGGCRPQGEGTDTLRVRTGALEPGTPVTLLAGMDIPTPPPGKELPWTQRWDAVLGTSVPVAVLVLLLAVGAGLLGFVLVRRTREQDPGFPLLYAPPEGIGPAQAAYLVSEDVGDEQYVATLMYAAERGAIDLNRSNDTWTITDKNGSEGWAGLDPVTSGVAHLLGGPGASFRASPKDVEAGKRLKAEMERFEESTRSWARSSGLMVASGLGNRGALVIGASALAVLAIAWWNPLDMTLLGLVPGLFAVFGAGLAATGAGTRRTRAGRDLWSRSGGFRRILSTPSAEDRFDFAARKDLYTAYVPWAVAFGCADEWAEKYRTEMGSEPPVPSYFGGYYGGMAAGSAVSSMVGDFQSTVSSAISSYEATQKSSSSGGVGGSFSGGGGGGGGGVGSW
ncbi:DUF2207 domain-containing protein [Nocardioides aquiterrae]|uniref:DUF2207 domain-containing protein n=1 Tax=Nocardioides aquiterrae TaxID=203799 RepID=A0ABP4FCM2_9ACTN